jgi:hypothetical protein
MFNNPYPKERRLKCILARVDAQDYVFVTRRFYLAGMQDKILSNLFKKFVDELKRLHNIEPIEGGLSDPFPVLEDIFNRLVFVDRCAAGSTNSGGNSSPQHDERGVGGLHKAVLDAKVECPESKGRTKGGRRTKTKKAE